jgi:hypothetical protein
VDGAPLNILAMKDFPMKALYLKRQRTALLVAFVAGALVAAVTTAGYGQLTAEQISYVKLDGTNIFRITQASQGLNSSPGNLKMSFGVGDTFSAAVGGGSHFDYLATLLGQGRASYGSLGGLMVTDSSSLPDHVMGAFGQIDNDGRALSHGYERLGFRDTGVVTSFTLATGTPVTLNFSVSLTATGYFSGRPTAFNSEYRVDANYTGAVDDISPGATGSQYTGINGGGVLNFPFNTAVGNTLQIYGMLDIYNNVQAGRDYSGATYYQHVQAGIDASHTARVSLAAPAGVTFASASGHDYTSTTDPAPAPLAQAAGFLTSIPGGTGNFTSLPAAPAYSSTGELAFYGTGASGQQGIYRIVNQGVPVRVADLNTPIPGGSGNFTSFIPQEPVAPQEPTKPSISGSSVVFFGAGSGGQQGIYVSIPQDPIVPGNPVRIADTSTAIPGGTGTFTSFTHPGIPPSPIISGNNVVFFGAGSGGQQGIYRVIPQEPSVPGNPVKVVDLNTAIPDGSGNFTAIPQEPMISGNNVVFLGNGAGGQQGVYVTIPVDPIVPGNPVKVADLNTAIPGGTGNFTSFIPVEPFAPAIDGTRVAFFGAGSGGQQGIYVSIPQDPVVPGNPVRIADTSTAIPGGTGTFTGFRNVSISATDVAFLGLGQNGQQGIYDLTGGSLVKVVDLADLVDGRAITGLNLSRSALVGDPLAFQLTFADGSQALYTWSRPVLAGDFNADGKVDAADYVVWRKGLGTTYTPNDYNAWRANFGATVGSGSGSGSNTNMFTNASQNVPEPATLVLVVLGAMALWRQRFRVPPTSPLLVADEQINVSRPLT